MSWPRTWRPNGFGQRVVRVVVLGPVLAVQWAADVDRALRPRRRPAAEITSPMPAGLAAVGGVVLPTPHRIHRVDPTAGSAATPVPASSQGSAAGLHEHTGTCDDHNASVPAAACPPAPSHPGGRHAAIQNAKNPRRHCGEAQAPGAPNEENRT